MRNLTVSLVSIVLGCSSPSDDGPGSGPPDASPKNDADAAIGSGGDVTTPFPIDGTSLPGAPATYKGLSLALTNTGTPVVTPVRGVIGVVCVGMSNATQECTHFIESLSTAYAGQVAPEVRVVDCARGGHAIEKWNDPAYDDILWNNCLGPQIAAASLAADQIRVIYHKAADQFTTIPGTITVKPPYPDPASDYFVFHNNLTTFATRLAQKIPTVQAVYTTSRSYGGFANKEDRSEPLSYEEGHALNQWLATHGTLGGVWYGWGPYIWAPECAAGTNGSGTCYVRTDYQTDGVHPDTGARDKIAALIHARLLQHDWYAQ